MCAEWEIAMFKVGRGGVCVWWDVFYVELSEAQRSQKSSMLVGSLDVDHFLVLRGQYSTPLHSSP